ncbi:MAG TPA: hypothetical protein VIN08_05460 [Ohtaekwangia sp.]|uniref:hypothetical protein n=1 Tax=Ohtaekwangia sp. TaxID=2066019 RepID=UPI002F93BFA5
MKKLSAWLFLSLFIGFIACDKDDNEPNNSITSEEAAQIVSTSFASNSSGVNFVSGEAAASSSDLAEQNANGRTEACGISKNIDLSGASPDGATIVWSYDFSYKFKLNCNDQQEAANVSIDLSYSGSYDGPKLKTEHSGVSQLTVNGLEKSVENFLLAGSYRRSGSFEQKNEEKKAGNSTIEITLTDIVIDKQTHEIISGTATYKLSGTVASKGDYSYQGTVTFEGQSAATIKVGSDNFSLNLKNGEVVKK